MHCLELFAGMFELIDHFPSEIVHARAKPSNVLFVGHVLDDMHEDVPEFGERRLFCHMRRLYHDAHDRIPRATIESVAHSDPNCKLHLGSVKNSSFRSFRSRGSTYSDDAMFRKWLSPGSGRS
jgi:hypothetical protein